IIGADESVEVVVYLITMKAIYLSDEDFGITFEEKEPPADMLAQCEEYREKLVEAAAEASEELMEKYFGGEELTHDELYAAIRQRVLAGEIVPVMCGTAFKNKGVQALLDAVVRFLPAPNDVEAIRGELPTGEEA